MDEITATGDISRHKCLIYDGHPSEQIPVVVPLLAGGLKDNWRCLYLGDPPTVEMIQTALASNGINTAREEERGALLFSSDRSHLADGKFDPSTMVGGLRSSIDVAVKDGFEGLCATGDMRWELGEDANFGRLLEYEALLEQVFHEKPLMGICQYHRSLVPEEAVRDALLTHRSAYVGDMLNRDNLFYIPPKLLLETRSGLDGVKYGDWMCQQILRVMGAERERDRVIEALKESEAQQRELAGELAVLNRDLEARIAARTRELEIANKDLGALNQHLEAFSYSVSHDLRAPLRAIRGFSEILVEDYAEQLGDQARETISRIVAGASQMDQLIAALLEMGRATKGTLRPERLDLSALARELIGNVRASSRLAPADGGPSRLAPVDGGPAPQRDADISVADGMLATGDRALVRTALTNLIENAWKFTSRVERARIEVGQHGPEDKQQIFFVRDNGAGFDMQHAKRLFGAFQRLHRQSDFPGTGVGLATTARIIEKHGGRIWAESRPGEGATFFFTLPAEV